MSVTEIIFVDIYLQCLNDIQDNSMTYVPQNEHWGKGQSV